MRKGLAISLIVFFVPAYVSLGDDVGQVQGYLIDADNGVLLAGAGAAQNVNVAHVNQNQQSNNPYSLVTALQTESGTLVQSASAVGLDGVLGVAQTANVLDGQLQAAGAGTDLGVQDQVLNSAFGQDLVSVGGIGAAIGIQGFVGLDVQLIISPYGASANVQYLGLAQADSIGNTP
jgi:hypothetical protein